MCYCNVLIILVICIGTEKRLTRCADDVDDDGRYDNAWERRNSNGGCGTTGYFHKIYAL